MAEQGLLNAFERKDTMFLPAVKVEEDPITSRESGRQAHLKAIEEAHKPRR